MVGELCIAISSSRRCREEPSEIYQQFHRNTFRGAVITIHLSPIFAGTNLKTERIWEEFLSHTIIATRPLGPCDARQMTKTIFLRRRRRHSWTDSKSRRHRPFSHRNPPQKKLQKTLPPRPLRLFETPQKR